MSSLRAAPFVPALALTLAAAALPGDSAPPPYPPRALVLFVASWCAPCRAELARLDSIAANAAPLDVSVVPIDRSAATIAMLRGVPPARVLRSARTLDAFLQDGGSLPFSVMTDARGRACATHLRALDASAIAAMRRRCDVRD